MTNRSGQVITWDLENRPRDIGPDFMLYDGDGKRIRKTEGGQTILYIGRYYEKNLSTGEVTTYYYLGSKMVAKRAGTTLTYLHQDSLGSTSVVTDSSGAKVASSRYYPYGGTWSASGTLPAQRFTGQRLDASGLYYYNARYYDANLGRFISADTIVPNPADPQALNRYSYTLNNPLKHTDPSGHNPWFVLPLIGAVVGAGAAALGYMYTTPASQRTGGGWAKAIGAGAVSGALSVALFPVLPAGMTGFALSLAEGARRERQATVWAKDWKAP